MKTPLQVLVLGMDTLQPEPPPGKYTSEELAQMRRSEMVRASCRTSLMMLSDVGVIPLQEGDPAALAQAVALLREVAEL